MFTSFLSHLDWLSVSAGAITGMAICGVVSMQLSKKIKRQVNEQQQQLMLLQSQHEQTQSQYAALVEEHDLLGLTHQEQRDQSQHFLLIPSLCAAVLCIPKLHSFKFMMANI